MGKAKQSARATTGPARQEPQDSWMKELQLQAVAADTAQWSQHAYQPALWQSFQVRARVRRFH
jgi:hypothetical protein